MLAKLCARHNEHSQSPSFHVRANEEFLPTPRGNAPASTAIGPLGTFVPVYILPSSRLPLHPVFLSLPRWQVWLAAKLCAWQVEHSQSPGFHVRATPSRDSPALAPAPAAAVPKVERPAEGYAGKPLQIRCTSASGSIAGSLPRSPLAARSQTPASFTRAEGGRITYILSDADFVQIPTLRFFKFWKLRKAQSQLCQGRLSKSKYSFCRMLVHTQFFDITLTS